MSEPVKIQIKKDDELSVVAARVFSAESDQVVLVVPNFSKLSADADNLKFLKSGLATSGKGLIIESVDDKLVKSAKRIGLAAENPFFVRQQLEQTEEINNQDVAEDEEEAPALPESKSPEKDVYDRVDRELEKLYGEPARPVKNKGRILSGVVLVSLLAVAWWTAAKILPQAEIQITTKKTDWAFAGEVIVDKNAVVEELASLKIPGQVFSQNKNGQMNFPASSKKTVSQKAKGTITIYNAYSSDSQQLVAATRFQTSDGKIIRLEEKVTVPGAKIVNGKINPSSIEAKVTADQPGQEYNIGPVAKLTVPGLSRSPKYDGFYGEIKTPLSGGYIGERAYPTDSDIEQGKEKIVQAFKDAAKLSLSTQVPADFKVMEGADQSSVVKLEVDKATNDQGEFSVFADVNYLVMGFREQDLLAALDKKMKAELGDSFNAKSNQLNYQLSVAQLEKDQLTLAIDFKAVAEETLDVKDLRQRIAGQSEADLKAMIFGLTGVQIVEVSLWPFWVSQAPVNEEKIKINID